MKEKRTKLEEMQVIYNKFPKFVDVPKDVLDLFIFRLEFEIRDYYKDKISKPKNPP